MAEDRVDRVSWTAHPKSVFLWPLVLAGYLFWLLESWGTNTAGLGWAYIWVTILVVMAVTVDLNRNYMLFCVVTVVAIIFVGWWLRDVKGVTVFGNIYRAFADLDVQYNRSFGLALSILLSIIFLGGLLWAWTNNRYTMTHNEIVHHVLGRGDISIGRGARVIKISYPDFFEAVLCLAGTIAIYDNTGRAQLLKTEHVPLLYFRNKKIDKILETLEVTSDDSAGVAADGADHAGADDLH